MNRTKDNSPVNTSLVKETQRHPQYVNNGFKQTIRIDKPESSWKVSRQARLIQIILEAVKLNAPEMETSVRIYFQGRRPETPEDKKSGSLC